MRVPIKLTALFMTYTIVVAGFVYAFLNKDTTVVIVGTGIVGTVIGANAVCDYGDRRNKNAH